MLCHVSTPFTILIFYASATFYSDVSGLACAPDFLSGRRFFDAMSGPTWYINSTAYGHADFMNTEIYQVVEVFQLYPQLYFALPLQQLFKKERDLCGNNPKSPKKEYKQFVGGQTVSFMNAVLDPMNSCHLFDNLEASGILGIETENDYAANGWQRCSALRCERVPV